MPSERPRPLDYSNLEPPPTVEWTLPQKAALVAALVLVTLLVLMSS